MSITTRDWVCPVCGKAATMSSRDELIENQDLILERSSLDKGVRITSHLIRCPNSKCNEYCLSVSATYGDIVKKPNYAVRHVVPDADKPIGVGTFHFSPTSPSPLSEYVSSSITRDYNEAWLIKTLSPKASATLARRALQGMIRDFWGIKKQTLHLEIEALKTKIDKDFYEAIKAVKGIGNIGAHSEKNINVIIDIEPGEAEALLELLHLLDKEWYVVRANKQRTLEKISEISEKKKAQKKGV